MNQPPFKTGATVRIIVPHDTDHGQLATVVECRKLRDFMHTTVLVEWGVPPRIRRWFLPSELRLDVIATLGDLA